MNRTVLCIVTLLLSCQPAVACWSAIDPSAFAWDCPLILQGKIVAVAEARPGEDRLDDQASIRVDAIHKNELKDVPLKVGGIFTVRMISRNNRSRSSTDINYPVGTEAVWLVVLNTKGQFRIDTHPVQCQKKSPERMIEMSRLDREDRADEGKNPLGRYTINQWVQKHKDEEARAAKHRAKQQADAKLVRDLAQELAAAPKIDGDALRTFRAAPIDIRRDVFQLRDHEQPLEGDRLDDVVELVLATEPSPNVRVFAGNALAYTKKPGRRSNQILAAALADPDADARMFLCQALRLRDARDQAAAVAALLSDKSPQVRDMAAHTLAHFFSREFSILP